MRRPLRPTPGVRPLAALTLGASLLLTGCGAGQLAQTNIQDSKIDGLNAAAGTVEMRYVYIEVPEQGVEGYAQGDDAPLYATFVNIASEPAVLQGVQTDAAEEVVILRGTGGDAEFGAADPNDAVEGEDPTSDGEGVDGLAGSPSPSPAVSGSASPDAETSPSPSEDGSPSPSEDGSPSPSEDGSPSPSGEASPSPQGGGEEESGGTQVSTLEIPPRGQTQLIYGVDYSLELRGLTRPLRPGELVTMTFQFSSGTAEVQVPVQTLKVFPTAQEAPEHEEE